MIELTHDKMNKETFEEYLQFFTFDELQELYIYNWKVNYGMTEILKNLIDIRSKYNLSDNTIIGKLFLNCIKIRYLNSFYIEAILPIALKSEDFQLKGILDSKISILGYVDGVIPFSKTLITYAPNVEGNFYNFIKQILNNKNILHTLIQNHEKESLNLYNFKKETLNIDEDHFFADLIHLLNSVDATNLHLKHFKSWAKMSEENAKNIFLFSEEFPDGTMEYSPLNNNLDELPELPLLKNVELQSALEGSETILKYLSSKSEEKILHRILNEHSHHSDCVFDMFGIKRNRKY